MVVFSSVMPLCPNRIQNLIENKEWFGIFLAAEQISKLVNWCKMISFFPFLAKLNPVLYFQFYFFKRDNKFNFMIQFWNEKCFVFKASECFHFSFFGQSADFSASLQKWFWSIQEHMFLMNDWFAYKWNHLWCISYPFL